MTIIAGLLSVAIFSFIAWLLTRLKEPPATAFIALTIFGAVPVLLLLKAEIANYAFETPQGKWVVKVTELEQKVQDVQTRATNLSATVTAATEGRTKSSSSNQSVPLGARAKIVDVDPRDSWYAQKSLIVGRTALLAEIKTWDDGWSYGDVTLEHPPSEIPGGRITFHRFKYELLK